MAKKSNKKKRRSPNERNLPPLPASKPQKKQADTKPANNQQATRETVESLVIALVLAFLFRTFQAEAFVIPTGSMSPVLMGMHKDVYCDQCGQRFKVNASLEGEAPSQLDGKVRGYVERVPGSPNRYRNGKMPGTNRELTPGDKVYQSQTVCGACQNCRYPMPFRSDLPKSVPETAAGIDFHNTSSGDRILVNKYLYSFTDPRRWDVVVFKYPGDAKQNYIKRLVGLPNETLRIYQGDVYRDAGGDGFDILRKPADKVLAMRQLVHDTDHDPASMFEAGWPLRWGFDDEGSAGQIETEVEGKTVRQVYRIGGKAGEETDWLRYAHTPPTVAAWRRVRELQAEGQPLDGALADAAGSADPRLVTDFNSYNTEVSRWDLTNAGARGFRPDIALQPDAEGLHWASDLSVDADLEVKSEGGALLLDLVECGQHFICEINIATGEATLRVLQYETGEQVLSLSAAQTKLKGAGSYEVRFANVDDQLLLWINGSLVTFEGDGAYDATEAFGKADRLAPKTSDADLGDLLPVGVGARGAEVVIDRLQVFRDIYYIADRWPLTDVVTDYSFQTRGSPRGPEYIVETSDAEGLLWQIARDPKLWPVIADRNAEEFPIGADQLFVMGDNSPQSSDCRLWAGSQGPGRPGGDYLERSLLTGKAVCVYWPHALVSIPTPKRGVRIPIVPNLGDIRLVR